MKNNKRNIINIFTDGGSFENNSIIAYSGIIFFNGKKIKKFSSSERNKTSTYAEIKAIRESLFYLNEYISLHDIDPLKCDVIIYSDALTVVNRIRDIINAGHIKDITIYGYYMYKSICKLMKKFEGNIKVYHIRSHMLKTDTMVNYNSFIKDNNVVVTKDTFKFIMEQNTKCDRAVKEAYYDLKSKIPKSYSKTPHKCGNKRKLI